MVEIFCVHSFESKRCIIELAFSENVRMLKMRLTCLLPSLGLTRLVVSLGLALSEAVMLTRERQNQKHRMKGSCLLLLHKGKTQATAHISFITYMKTPVTCFSSADASFTNWANIHIISLWTLFLTRCSGKAHWLFRLTLHYYTHIQCCLMQSSHQRVLLAAYSDHRLHDKNWFSRNMLKTVVCCIILLYSFFLGLSIYFI